MTFAAIFIPDWVTYAVDSPSGGHYTKTIGLHRSCSSTSGSCIHFPQKEDCHGSDRYFCSMWRSVGFLMSFAAVLELATIVAYVIIIGGGKQKRETGWKVLAFMLMLVGIVQCAGMAIVVSSPSRYLRLAWRRYTNGCRPTSSIMMIASSSGGSWISPGSFAPSVGALQSLARH